MNISLTFYRHNCSFRDRKTDLLVRLCHFWVEKNGHFLFALSECAPEPLCSLGVCGESRWWPSNADGNKQPNLILLYHFYLL